MNKFGFSMRRDGSKSLVHTFGFPIFIYKIHVEVTVKLGLSSIVES